MIGIIGRLKQSRISKICAFILSLMVGLSSFVLLSPTAYAANYMQVGSGSCSIVQRVSNGFLIENDEAINWQTRYTIRLSIDNWNVNNYYVGYFILNAPVTIALDNAAASNGQIVEVTSTGNFDVNWRSYAGSGQIITYDSSQTYWHNTRINGGITFIIPFEGQWSDGVWTFDITVNIRFDYRINTPNNPTWTYSWGDRSYSTFIRYCKASELVLEDILDAQNASNQSLISTLNTNSNNQVNAITGAATQAHSDSQTLNNSVNSAASQAHSDSQTINNNILHDSSGSSQNSASVQASYEAANQAADTAVDSAVHNYDSQLAEVENVNFDNFFTSQNMAVTFWRDVGEFVLDSSNLGYIASGMIIVTLIGLFVFLLRL